MQFEEKSQGKEREGLLKFSLFVVSGMTELIVYFFE